jgi:hypothetical protein
MNNKTIKKIRKRLTFRLGKKRKKRKKSTHPIVSNNQRSIQGASYL